jgi:predicted lipoprotein
MLVQSEIKKWPINTHFIEDFLIEEATIDSSFVASTGSKAKGLATVEYFLFDPALTNAEIIDRLSAAPKRMAYLVAASEEVAAKAAELYNMWAPDGGNQIQALTEADFSGNNVQGSISMLANEMIVLAERINKDKLDYPLRGILAEAQPEAVESAYARESIPLIIRNLESMQELFTVGFNDYLDFLQTDTTAPLAPRINAQIAQIITMLAAFDMPLQDAVVEDPDAVRATRDAVRALIVLLKVDMANQLGITVTFGDNDGD